MHLSSLMRTSKRSNCQTPLGHVRNARFSQSGETLCQKCWRTAPWKLELHAPCSSAVKTETSNYCAMEPTSAWYTAEAAAHIWENPEETVGFSPKDAKEFKISSLTIKIDVRSDEMNSEADTKHVENAAKSVKLVGSKGVGSPRVRNNEQHTAQMESSEEFTPADPTCSAAW